MLDGIGVLAHLLRSVYGPYGSRVLMARMLDTPLHVSSSGQVAGQLQIAEPLPGMGLRFLQSALEEMDRCAGDGGTTMAILLQELLGQGLRAVSAGRDPTRLRRGISHAAELACARLRLRAMRLDDAVAVSALLAASDFEPHISSLIRQAVEQVGVSGCIMVLESTFAASQLVVHDGMHFRRGLPSNVLATDTVRMQASQERPRILVLDGVLHSAQEVRLLMEGGSIGEAPVFIVAREIEAEALSTIVSLHLARPGSVLAINAPEYGEQRDEVLYDIAACTGGMVFSGLVTDHPADEYYGWAQKVVVAKHSTQIIGPARDTLQCAVRLRHAMDCLKPGLSQHDAERVRQRIGNLQGAMAELHIGGITDVEMGERHGRVSRFIHLLGQRIGQGLLPGGASAYVGVARELCAGDLLDEDERTGVAMLSAVLLAPARQLLRNAHLDDATVRSVLDQYMMEGQSAVFDAVRREWVPAIPSGVVDSVHVLTESIRVAASVAASLLQTGMVLCGES